MGIPLRCSHRCVSPSSFVSLPSEPSSGPYGANIFNPRSWGNGSIEITNTITLEVTRVVLAIGVFAIGVELPKAYMQRHWKSILFLLGPVMTWVRSIPSLRAT